MRVVTAMAMAALMLSGVGAQQVVVRDLGTLGGGFSMAYGINNIGQVVGASLWQTEQIRPFRTQPNSPIQPETDLLGTLGGSEAWGFAINDGGQVVGYSLLADETTMRAFLAEPDGTLVDLGTLGGTDSMAFAINAFGDVAGASLVNDNPAWRAFVKLYGQEMRDLGDLGGGESVATGVNNLGVVVGYSVTGNLVERAFVWTESTGMVEVDGREGFWRSFATAVSDTGIVVGYGTFEGYRGNRAFAWTASDGMVLLETYYGTMESRALGVNSRGVIVGSYLNAEGSQRACAWFPELGVVDLNDLLPSGTRWVLLEATGVNDGDQIVGYGLRDGVTRAFLLEIGLPDTFSITGKVTLGDFTGDPRWVPVTVELRQEGAITRTATLTLDEEGNYRLPEVEPGTYDLAFKASHWLRVAVSGVTVTEADVDGVDVTLLNGDIDGDNEVTLFDFGALVAAFGSMPGDSNWNPDADLDGDEEVTLFDFGILVRNFGQMGDE